MFPRKRNRQKRLGLVALGGDLSCRRTAEHRHAAQMGVQRCFKFLHIQTVGQEHQHKAAVLQIDLAGNFRNRGVRIQFIGHGDTDKR